MHIKSFANGIKITVANVWQSGRESGLLDDIIAGRKTIEGRLNKGKFAQYQVGDRVQLRRDYRDSHGVLHDGELAVVTVEIIAIRRYDSFMDMVQAEGYMNVIPAATSTEAAACEYTKYYAPEDERRFGVLAIEIRVDS